MANRYMPNVGAELARVHRAITRGLDVAIANTQRLLTDLEESRHEGYLSYAQSLATVIDGHHEVEDRIVFPFFRTRVTEAPYEHLTVQHQEMLGNLRELKAALSDLSSGKRVQAIVDRAAEALRRLDATWVFHIETEESHLSPERVPEVATLDEQVALLQRIGEFNAEHLQPAALCIPFLLYNLDVEDRAIMASRLPQEVIQELVPGAWKEQWAPMRPFLLE